MVGDPDPPNATLAEIYISAMRERCAEQDCTECGRVLEFAGWRIDQRGHYALAACWHCHPESFAKVH